MFPTAFGQAPRDFFKHCHEFSGEEWKQQANHYLLVYLSKELAADHYEAFCGLVETICMYIASPRDTPASLLDIPLFEFLDGCAF